MAYPIYSERFIQYAAANNNSWMNYAVPPGKRAIVRNVIVTNYGPAGVQGVVLINGITAWAHTFQASERSLSADLRGVAYGGELISCIGDAPNMQIHVSGYLFDDTIAARAPRVTTDEVPPGWEVVTPSG